jgi:hypothetical protein
MESGRPSDEAEIVHGVSSPPSLPAVAPRPRALTIAAREELLSGRRKARARTRNPDLGSDRTGQSTSMNMRPPGRQRPVGEFLSEGVQPKFPAYTASVADRGQLVAHAVASVRGPDDRVESDLSVVRPANARPPPHSSRSGHGQCANSMIEYGQSEWKLRGLSMNSLGERIRLSRLGHACTSRKSFARRC